MSFIQIKNWYEICGLKKKKCNEFLPEVLVLLRGSLKDQNLHMINKFPPILTLSGPMSDIFAVKNNAFRSDVGYSRPKV